MGAPAAGTVVLIDFPFSDLSGSKRRPALVLANAERGDSILCQITSQGYADRRAVILEEPDFQRGSLQRTSYARPGKLFTAHSSLISRSVGVLGSTALQRVIDEVVALLGSGSS